MVNGSRLTYAKYGLFPKRRISPAKQISPSPRVIQSIIWFAHHLAEGNKQPTLAVTPTKQLICGIHELQLGDQAIKIVTVTRISSYTCHRRRGPAPETEKTHRIGEYPVVRYGAMIWRLITSCAVDFFFVSLLRSLLSVHLQYSARCSVFHAGGASQTV